MLVDKDSWFQRLFLEYKGTKLLSLLLAVISWYSIRGVIGVTKVIHGIPIVVRVKEGTAVLSQSASSATVTFKGSQEDLARLEEAQLQSQLRVLIYAETAEPGSTETISIQPRHVEGAKSVRATKINKPSHVQIKLDKESEEQFLVNVRHDKPLVGQLVSVVCDPPYVAIRGPRTELDRLRQAGETVVDTENIALGDISTSFARSVRVLPPGQQWVSEINPPEVLVSVTVERKHASRTWENVPVTALVAPARSLSVTVRPTHVRMTVSGRSEVLQELDADQMTVFVDCMGLDMSATYDLPVRIHTPPELDLTATVEPDRAKVVMGPNI